jgi:hypothetical protein
MISEVLYINCQYIRVNHREPESEMEQVSSNWPAPLSTAMTFLRLLLLGAAAGLARGHGQAVEQKDDANWDAKGYAEQHVSAEASAFLCIG